MIYLDEHWMPPQTFLQVRLMEAILQETLVVSSSQKVTTLPCLQRSLLDIHMNINTHNRVLSSEEPPPGKLSKPKTPALLAPGRLLEVKTVGHIEESLRGSSC